jgi:hypothetical protein
MENEFKDPAFLNTEESECVTSCQSNITSTKQSKIEKIEDFFCVTLPEHLKDSYRDRNILKQLGQEDILSIIDFTPVNQRLKVHQKTA